MYCTISLRFFFQFMINYFIYSSKILAIFYNVMHSKSKFFKCIFFFIRKQADTLRCQYKNIKYISIKCFCQFGKSAIIHTKLLFLQLSLFFIQMIKRVVPSLYVTFKNFFSFYIKIIFRKISAIDLFPFSSYILYILTFFRLSLKLLFLNVSIYAVPFL